MVGVLIVFVVNNLLWSLVLLSVISLLNHKPLSKIFSSGVKKEEEEFSEPTPENFEDFFNKKNENLIKEAERDGLKHSTSLVRDEDEVS